MTFRNIHLAILSPVPLACALALAAPLAQAQIQASATLSNLSVRVVDLNTADQIKPLATLGGALSFYYDGSVIQLNDVVGAGNQALSDLPYATGSYGGGKISLSATLGDEALAQGTTLPGVYAYNDTYEYAGRAINPDTGLMTNYVNRITSQYASVYTNVGHSVQSGFTNGDMSLPSSSLTLAPGTLAIVSGDVLTSVTTDSRWLSALGQQLNLPTDNIGSWNDLTATASATFSMSAEAVDVVSGPNGGSTTSSAFQGAEVQAVDAFDRNGVLYRTLTDSVDPQNVTSSFNQTISLVVQNWSTQDMVFNLKLMQTATIVLSGSHSNYTSEHVWDLASGVPVDVTTPPVPNIPEPGTWMLMGLGMGGVAWARRRQTQQQTAEGAQA